MFGAKRTENQNGRKTMLKLLTRCEGYIYISFTLVHYYIIFDKDSINGLLFAIELFDHGNKTFQIQYISL